MRKLFVFAALAGALMLAPKPSWADPRQDVQDAMTRMQQGIPVLMRTIEVLSKEGPQIIEIMQKASVEAEKTGGPNFTPGSGQMPTADQMAQKLRGLQSMIDVMRQALPIMERMQKELDPARMSPSATPYRAPRVNDAPASPPRVDPDLQL